MTGGGAVQGVYVPARICQILEDRLPLTALRGRILGDDSEVDQVLLDIRTWAMAWGGRVPATNTATETRPALEWLTPGQAASRLGVAEDTVRRAIRERRLPAEKHANRWRVRATDLTTYRRS